MSGDRAEGKQLCNAIRGARLPSLGLGTHGGCRAYKKLSRDSRNVVPGSPPPSHLWSFCDTAGQRLRDRGVTWGGVGYVLWGRFPSFSFLSPKPGPWGQGGRVSEWRQDGVKTTR